MHRRQPRRGCRGHIPQYFGWGDVNGNIPPILLRTFGYSRSILVALRSLSLKPFSFGYKTQPIRFSPLPHPRHSVVRPPQPRTRVDATAYMTCTCACTVLASLDSGTARRKRAPRSAPSSAYSTSERSTDRNTTFEDRLPISPWSRYYATVRSFRDY